MVKLMARGQWTRGRLMKQEKRKRKEKSPQAMVPDKKRAPCTKWVLVFLKPGCPRTGEVAQLVPVSVASLPRAQ